MQSPPTYLQNTRNQRRRTRQRQERERTKTRQRPVTEQRPVTRQRRRGRGRGRGRGAVGRHRRQTLRNNNNAVIQGELMADIDNNLTQGTFGKKMNNSNNDNDSIRALGETPEDFSSAFHLETLISDHRNSDYIKTRPPNLIGLNKKFFEEKDDLHARTENQRKPANNGDRFRNAVKTVVNNMREEKIKELQDMNSSSNKIFLLPTMTRSQGIKDATNLSPRPENLTTPSSTFTFNSEISPNPSPLSANKKQKQNSTGEGSRKKKRKRRRSRKKKRTKRRR